MHRGNNNDDDDDDDDDNDDEGVLCLCTSVVRHRGLIRVTLFLEGHVPQLQHSRHHLQQT